MANAMYTMVITIICINGMLYMGENFLVSQNLGSINFQNSWVLSVFFTQDTAGNINGLNQDVYNTLPKSVSIPGQTSDNTFKLIDTLAFVWDFIKILIGLVISPFYLLMLGIVMPQAFSLFIIAPLVVTYIMGIIFFARGVLWS